MSKRKYENQFLDPAEKKVYNRKNEKKHTLDSDEEDYVDEENVLNADDIEGEEDGIARQDGGQRMTAFNMKEEMEEGHFDKDGHFIWNSEKEIRDNWLDNIDWQRIKNDSNYKEKYNIDEDNKGLGDESESESEPEPDFDEIVTYKKILSYMNPKETVNKTIRRLNGAEKLSSLERLKRKKLGTLNTNEDVTNLTEFANQILTKLGNMDIYQETYEQIKTKIDASESKGKSKAKEPELDMYADDFDSKEKQKMQASTSDSGNGSTEIKEDKPQELMWEFKWNVDDTEIQGPYNTPQMIKWSKENYFKTGVMVRKCGENGNFYTSNRIDFELYE